ncbi:MAG: glycoside hydrolase family 88 protein [Chitinophagaceae bacterium]
MLIQRFLLNIFISTISVTLTAQTSAPITDIYKTMKKVADWQINELDTKPWKYVATDWTNAALYTGMMAWAKMANDDKYLLWLKNIGEKLKWEGGPERFFADDYCVGQTYAELFMLYKDSAMIKPMMSIGDDLISQPHTESLLWNFDGGLHNREWAWCDALYMGPPMLAYLSTATAEKKYLDIADKLWWRSANYLYDPTEQLFFRDSRFFDKKEKNGAKVFWSRGNGWVIAGIARILNNMPANYPTRKGYERIFKEMAKRIASLQQTDGTWHASMLDPKSYPVKETSGTAFFTYALTWGINNGLLSDKEYFPVIDKAWTALKDCLHEDGKLGFVQVPGAAPEKVTFDDTEVYGVGAFLLAGTELFKLQFKKEAASTKITVQNPTAENRKNEMVEIKWKQLNSLKFNPQNTTVFNAQTNLEVPSQIIYDEKKSPKTIIFQSETAAAGTSYFYIKQQKPQAYAAKTFGRLVPERMDDFAWENDRLAFRMYGPALQKSGEISSGIDIWAKRTTALVIDKWYKSEDYHHDRGEGLDFYGVGLTLGAGGTAPYINNKLYPSENFISYKVLDNGPLRTRFQLNYNKWNAAGIKVKETKIITLDAGSFLNKIEEAYKFCKKELPIAAGLAILPGTDGKVWNDVSDYGLLAYQQPKQENGIITTGIVIPQKCTTAEIALTEKDHYNHTGHYILATTIKKRQPFTYYQGANWDKEGSFKNLDDWKQYLKSKVIQLQNPFIIQVQ